MSMSNGWFKSLTITHLADVSRITHSKDQAHLFNHILNHSELDGYWSEGDKEFTDLYNMGLKMKIKSKNH
jgi:hypothetical protein